MGFLVSLKGKKKKQKENKKLESKYTVLLLVCFIHSHDGSPWPSLQPEKSYHALLLPSTPKSAKESLPKLSAQYSIEAWIQSFQEKKQIVQTGKQ